MKKTGWNTVVFLVWLAYCLLFSLLFWFVFDNNELYWRYFGCAFRGLLIALAVNTISQILAIILRKKPAAAWLLLGVAAFFLTIAFTTAQGV